MRAARLEASVNRPVGPRRKLRTRSVLKEKTASHPPTLSYLSAGISIVGHPALAVFYAKSHDPAIGGADSCGCAGYFCYSNQTVSRRLGIRDRHGCLGDTLILKASLAGFLVVASLLAVDSRAQQPSPPPPPTPQPAQTSPHTTGTDQQGQGRDQGTSNDRLFYALPNFLTLENAGQVPPLTTGQKFKVVARSSFDPVVFVWYGFLAAVSQAENSEPGYGQGAAGYGKRYGAAFADTTIESFLTGAVLPSLLRQDPRFFQEGNGSFVHRTGYAISRIFITRTDSGKEQFNYSEVMGSAASAAISTYSYHPSGDRTVTNTASVWGSLIGYDTLTIVAKEFWPDIRRKLRKK